MNKGWKMRLSFFMKLVNEYELGSGLGTVLSTITPLGGLITALVVRYTIMFCSYYTSNYDIFMPSLCLSTCYRR